jgi:hypothetical protein
MIYDVGAGVVWRRVGTLASPLVEERLSPQVSSDRLHLAFGVVLLRCMTLVVEPKTNHFKRKASWHDWNRSLHSLRRLYAPG